MWPPRAAERVNRVLDNISDGFMVMDHSWQGLEAIERNALGRP